MSQSKHGLYSSYMACFPTNVMAESELKGYYQPPECYPNGKARRAPLSLRILEAILHCFGFEKSEYATVPRFNLEKFVGEKTKVIAVSTMDPEGLGPLTQTLQLFYGDENTEPYTKTAFNRLMTEIKTLKEKYKQIKVVVGGPGAWQLSSHKLLEKYGIDHLVIGEVESIAPKLFGSLTAKENVSSPKIIVCEPADVDMIPPILDATINGLVEVSRGCGRGCSWCFSSTSGRMRCLPIEKIKKSVEANLKGKAAEITLQSNDILLYESNSKRFIPDPDAVLSLMKELYSMGKVGSVLPIHFSIASIAADPDLLNKLTALIKEKSVNLNLEKFVVQIGIETGSPRIIERYMRGKTLPFSPYEWPKIVKEALKTLDEEGWFCYGTLIFGFPEEDEGDINQTIELIRNLKGLKVIIIPLIFTFLNAESEKAKSSKKETLWKHLPLLYEIQRHNEKTASHYGNLGHLKFLKKNPLTERRNLDFLRRHVCVAN